MGRNSADYSESPVRNHRSSRRSPSRRETSPAHHRSARSPAREKPSNRTKSPRRAKSPTTHSPVTVREKPSSRTKSRSPSPRSKRLRRDRSNHKDDKSNEKGHDKNHGKTRSPVRQNSRSPESRSPSPRTRRLRRAEADKIRDRGHERNHNSGGDGDRRKERDPEREREGRDRKSGREKEDNGSSKSRHISSTEHHRSRHRSHSPSAARDEGNNSKEDDHRNGDDDSVARMKAAEEALETKEKQKPSFELSGKLAAETNRVKGVTLLFTEPPDARKPEVRWRLYVFKGGEALNEPLYVHRQTCYLFGRERRVADIPTDHPSCSKQHAVLQYRQVEKEQPDGMLKKEIRPYIMDLGSTNGTFINDNRIEAERYYELMEKDTIKFGNSSREYVLLHENSA